MATASPQTSPWTVRLVATIAAGGGALGVALIATRSGHAASGCAAAVGHAAACVPSALASAKALVSAGLIGLLLGIVIAIAGVLTWREARAVREHLGAARPARPRAAAPHRRSLAVAHRARH